MSFKILVTGPFERKVKKLNKKHISLKYDLDLLITDLEQNPFQGKSIGNNCYKLRLAISSKGKGKSGGARIIIFVRTLHQTVYLIDIYDKSTRITISDNELKLLIEILNIDLE